MKRFLPAVLILSLMLLGPLFQPLHAQVVMENNETGTIHQISIENPLLGDDGQALVWLTTDRQNSKSIINITCNSTIDGMTFYRDNPGDQFALHYSDESGVFSWEWRDILGVVLDEDPVTTHTTDGSFTGTVFYGQSSTNVAWTYAIDIYLEDPNIPGSEYDAYFSVTDPTAGGGIAGAEVTVDGFGTQTTNSLGYATFLDLPNGSYTYTVDATGYDLREGIFSISNEDAGIVVDLSVEPTYQASFNVYEDGSSNPISGASIDVTGFGTQITSATGQASFGDLPDATYDFIVTATGYEDYSGQFFISNADETIYVNLIPEPSLFNANFTITDTDTGLAIENATINLDGIGTASSDASGQATFGDLADGTYSFTVTADGYDVYTADFIINGADEDININLIPEPSLFNANFTITDTDTGLAIENATINLDGIGTASSDASGQATFGDLADGTYSFTVTADGYDIYPGEFTINGADENVNLSMTPEFIGNTVTFIITDSVTSEFVDNATVSIDGVGNATSNASGQASFEYLAEGFYSYTVTAIDYDTYSDDFILTGGDEDINVILTPSGVGITDNLLSDIQISPNPAHSNLQVHSDPQAKNLVLTIYDVSGKPLQSYRLESGISQIDISELDKGLYLYSVSGETSGITTGKFVKN